MSHRLAGLAGILLATAPADLSAQGHQPPRRFYQGVSLSPDGQRIGLSAFIGGNLDIYTLRLDGSDLTRRHR